MNSPHDYAEVPEESDLLAYADGRLDADSARGRAVAGWLEQHPAAKQRVRDYRRQDEAIRLHYAPLHAAAVPPHLQPAVIRQRQEQHRSRWFALAALSFFAALALSWLVHLNQAPSELDRFARGVVLQMQAGVQQDLQAPAKSDPVTHDFIPPGFSLTGERRVMPGKDAMTEFVYESGEGRELRLFVGNRQPDALDAPKWMRDEGRPLVYWEQGSQLYALSGNVSEIELESVALRSMLGSPDVLRVADDALPAPAVDESQATLPPAVVFPQQQPVQVETPAVNPSPARSGQPPAELPGEAVEVQPATEHSLM